MKNGYEKSFVNECENTIHSLNNIFEEFKKNPDNKTVALEIKQDFEKLQRSAEFLEYKNLMRLFNAASKVFSSIYDEYIFYSKRIEQLLILVERNIKLSVKQLLETGEDSVEVDKSIDYCDRISSGEIVDFKEFSSENESEADIFSEWNKKFDEINSIPTVKINRSHLEELFNNFEEMISRTFRIEKEADLCGNHKSAKNIKADCQFLRTEIENLRDEIDTLRMLPLSKVCDELKAKYPEVKFEFDSEKIRLDEEVLTSLSQILPVFVNKKNQEIRINSIQGKYETTITIFDEAMKIDFEGIRNQALKLYPEMTNQIKEAGEKELSAFVFLKSFASNPKFYRVSKYIDKARGKIYVQNRESGGTEIVMTFPNSLSTRRGLFVRGGSKTFFIPANHIQDVISKWRSEIFLEQNQYFINFEEKKIPVYRLSSLFMEKSQDKGLINLIVIEYMEMKVAIAVDEVSAYSEITFRALPEAFKNFDILLGVAIDKEQRMIPILNVTELLIQLRKMRGFEMKKMEVLSKVDKQKILVVDDSSTSREIEGSILQANGFAVDEAVDGINAIEKLKDSKYSVIVTDTEMPRMNGLIFLENVRLLENYKDTPVIVVTPNTDEKIRQIYENAGANAFLTKNNFKRVDLIEMVKGFVNS